ncbi:mannose-1-phosphate guanylyltransferase/mannose-6-phosphate isomerase [Pleionea litopenaei]|uniref:mannose-1-phosphate guanylyltransferase n=1 Tax=Pleionea litopenaei TaxID=3070815 RepID=A0AA51X7M5_9GAMM|nr:mannose-1-phosphate guanylyltransferase/mannose-6-phosphate isomerase [Pleionea sp. HL-JVS1]WMS87265.1 mannose-1-phosphate guanylyltransferase/mannose-6-phosphate isomerase [Pleionea sp. HL-JVS1]
MTKIVPIVLAGGRGTRLWPLSRQDYPKPFLQLEADSESLYQSTLKRCQSLAELDSRVVPPVVVANHRHRFLVAQQALELNCKLSALIIEPIERNTAAAFSSAVMWAKEQWGDAQCILLPADHELDDSKQFVLTLLTLVNSLIASSTSVTVGLLGVRASEPSNQFGYMKTQGDHFDNPINQSGTRSVISFIEKPPLERAETLVKEEGWFWNSGVYACSTEHWASILNSIDSHFKALIESAVQNAAQDLEFLRLPVDDYKKVKNISVDYFVMEKVDELSQMNVECRMLELNCEWQDSGTWLNYSHQWPVDDLGNRVHGPVENIESRNNVVYSDEALVVTHGIKNQLIVVTQDCVYVGDKLGLDKTTFKQFAQKEHSQLLHHRRQFRPWGYFEVIATGTHFQVKRLSINAHSRLSLQSHQHRSEHWILVSGVASVIRGDEEFQLNTNESTFIPCGVVHRLSNPSNEILELIEVQTGQIIDEDDIMRFNDDFGR